MKKMLMMAAGLLLVASMMISCNESVKPSKNDPVVRTEVVRGMVYQKSEKDAVKALEAAGYVAEEGGLLVRAKSMMAKQPRKVRRAAAAEESLAYVKEIVPGEKYEVISIVANDKGIIDTYAVFWESISNDILADFGKQAKDMAMYCYAETKEAMFAGFISVDEKEEMMYLESEELREQLEEAQKMLDEYYKMGALTKEQYNEALEELEKMNGAGNHAGFVRDLGQKAENSMEAYAEYADEAAVKKGKGVACTMMADVAVAEQVMMIGYVHAEGGLDIEM